ncbi:MAG: hypothetical protein C5B49_08575 [Bdellovibrio sp.]|nr:MAG: hypothetical protein C5B49_08575 [Bdellovibrio sp.]
MPRMMRNPGPVAKFFILLIALWVASIFNFYNAPAQTSWHAIWLPAGMSLSALLLWGWSYAPAIFLSSLFYSLTIGRPLPAAVFIGLGNTLEPMCGAWMLQSVVGFQFNLIRKRDLLALVFLAAGASTLIGAATGTWSLSHYQQWFSDLATPGIFKSWWMSHAMGVLIVVPFLLALHTQPRRTLCFRDVTNAFGFLLLSVAVFAGTSNIHNPALPYLLCPVVLLVGVHYGQLGSSAAILALSLIANLFTSFGAGPFSLWHEDRFAMLDTFMVMLSIVSVTVIPTLAAAIQERDERTMELKQAKAQSDKANLAKSEFLANMSHEIRTPLSAILGYSELTLNPNQSSSERLKCLKAIRRNSEYLGNLINEVLDLSKIESGHLEIENLRFELHQTLEYLETLLGQRAQAKGIHYQLKIKDGLPRWVISDPTRLQQILLNVVGNAIKFTERGSVIVSVELIETEDAAGSSGHRMLQFLVEDTGPGISADKQSMIFRPFSQADASIQRRYGGTGLGLALSKKIANLMGGSVRLVRSTPGVGSAFAIQVAVGIEHGETIDGMTVSDRFAGAPWVDGSLDGPLIESQRQESLRQEKQLLGVRILLADDSPDIALIVRSHLTRLGADVATVTNGQEVLQRCLSESFDLVLMDIQMPVVDGYEAVKILRKSGYTRPVLALTAHAMRSDRERALDQGFDDHLTKPLEFGKLIDVITRFVDPDHLGPKVVRAKSH